jgi:hypothetical protein
LPVDAARLAVLWPSDEMQHEQYQAHNQGDVNETGGDMECEKSKQPEHNQHCGDDSQHVFLSLLLSVRMALRIARTG